MEFAVVTELDGGGRSLGRTCLKVQIPANRELTGNSLQLSVMAGYERPKSAINQPLVEQFPTLGTGKF